jgi:hypothetical protein
VVARMFSLGAVLRLSTLVSLGLSPLSAAQAAWPSSSAYTAPVAQPQFRPWSRADSLSPDPRNSRQRNTPAPRAAAAASRRWSFAPTPRRRVHRGTTPSYRTGARKAVPVTRGQDLGLRFRPDERESPYGQVTSPHDRGAYPSEPDSQFRPLQRKRKRTYEELQAENLPSQPPPAAPVLPYPMPAPPLPGYRGYWPTW